MRDPTIEQRALITAQRMNSHPVFERDDAPELAQAAFWGEAELEKYNLTANEIDALMSGLNIAREY